MACKCMTNGTLMQKVRGTMIFFVHYQTTKKLSISMSQIKITMLCIEIIESYYCAKFNQRNLKSRHRKLSIKTYYMNFAGPYD